MGTYVNIGNYAFANIRNGEYTDKSKLIDVVNRTMPASYLIRPEKCSWLASITIRKARNTHAKFQDRGAVNEKGVLLCYIGLESE